MFKARYGDLPAPKDFKSLGDDLNKLILNKDEIPCPRVAEKMIIKNYIRRLTTSDGGIAFLFGIPTLFKNSTVLYVDVGFKVIYFDIINK